MKVTGEQRYIQVFELKKKKSWITDLLAIDILSNWIDLTRILFWFNEVWERGSGHGKFQFYQNLSL